MSEEQKTTETREHFHLKFIVVSVYMKVLTDMCDMFLLRQNAKQHGRIKEQIFLPSIKKKEKRKQAQYKYITCFTPLFNTNVFLSILGFTPLSPRMNILLKASTV